MTTSGLRYDVREYGEGTDIASVLPWGEYVFAHAMCSDGRVRKTTYIAKSADTFFSVPAAVEVKGKKVSGYITVETGEGYVTETEDDKAVVKFVAYSYGKWAGLLPAGTWRRGDNQIPLDGQEAVG